MFGVTVFSLPLVAEHEHSEYYKPLLTWDMVHKKLPWGVIILLGGGFALAEACRVRIIFNVDVNAHLIYFHLSSFENTISIKLKVFVYIYQAVSRLHTFSAVTDLTVAPDPLGDI